MVMIPRDSNLRVRVENYACLNEVALARALMDMTNNSRIPISEMFTTISLAFDPESHTYKVPENLLNPPSISNDPGKSRIWNDFTFQEIGKGEQFINLESIEEKNLGVAAPGVSLPHPYLTADKAKQVNQWVSEGTGMSDSAPDSEPSARSQPDTDSASKTGSSVVSRPPPLHETKGPASPPKKPRGVKTRKPMPPANDRFEASAGSAAATSAEVSRPPSPNADKNAPTPTRRVWKMDHGLQPAQPMTTSNVNAASAAASAGSRTSARNCHLALHPQTPESKPRPSSSFDVTKYGLNKTPSSAGTAMKGSPRIQKPDAYQRGTPKPRYEKRNDLVDVFAPVTNSQGNAQPLLAFDQPALVPQNMSSSFQSGKGSPVQKGHPEAVTTHSHDLIGLEFGYDRVTAGTNGSDSDSESNFPNGDSGKNERRLLALKKLLENDEGVVTIPGEVTTNAGMAQRRPQDNRSLLRETLAQLERHHRVEERQSSEESTTREFYRTMQQKAPKPGTQPMRKTQKRAIRQATLEAAWGIPKTGSIDSVTDLPEGTASVESKENLQSQKAESKDEETTASAAAKKETDSHMNQSITTLFEALKPKLDAAEYFQGVLSLEAQIGLILVPLRPKTYHGGMISLDEWTNIFRSKKGLAAPTTKFINRVTTAGSDVDHIVDLKSSKADSKRRLFEREYTEYSVSYEYHCRTKADHEFFIAIDEQGKYTIKQPTAQLGTVNLHFPKQIWDGRVVVSGTSEHVPGSDPELEGAVQFLIDNLWVQPDRSLIRIFTKLPKENIFVVERVFMKRWTRHRHIRAGEALPTNNNTADASSVSESQYSAAASSKGEAPPADKESVGAQSDGNDNQDLFLQVTEVQDLLIGICPSDSQAVRARAAGPSEMIRTGRQWYEVSLVSPAIEDFLKSNSNIEIGERTEEWRSSDLLGKDAALLSSTNAATTTPVSTAIGAAGLGELIRLTQVVVEKLDGVGYWNGRPGPDALQAPTIAPNPPTTAPGTCPTPGPEAKGEQKSLDFDQIETISISEVGSVVAPAPAPASGPEIKAASASMVIASTVQGSQAPGVEYW